MLTGDALGPDPAISWPLACRIVTPAATVDLEERLPIRGGITLTYASADEVQQIASQYGYSFSRPEADQAGGCRLDGVKIGLKTEYGAEFTLLRPLTKLRPGDVVTLTENYSDRTQLRIWQNAIVTAPPVWPFMAHGGGREFHNIELQFLVVGVKP